jgi:hypothetical protein
MRWIVVGVIAALVLAGGSAGAAATGATAELKTALEHAGFAEKQESLKTATWHLHHVLNCLVGPKNPWFDASATNPCAGEGRGAIPDIAAGMGRDREYYVASWLARIAHEAIATRNLAEVTSAAHLISIVLRDIVKM